MNKQEIINFGIKLDISKNDILGILEKITGLNSSQLFLSLEIEDKFIEKIEFYFMRVVSGEPIEYILENANFYGIDFFVDSRVLIPRNDTEIMIDQVLEYIPEKTILIDVGTGSTCIPISILKNLNKNDENRILQTYVIDISEKALEVSKINIEKYNLENKIIQIKSNLLEQLELNTNILCSNGNINLNSIVITANLPYIKNGDFLNMDDETVEFEPELALYGGEETGFELYEKLIYQIFELESIYNIKNIILFLEIGFDQKEIAKDFLEKQNLQFEFFKDNGGVDRCIKIYFK